MEPLRRLFDGVEQIRLRRTVAAPKHLLSHRVIHAVFHEFEVDAFSPAMKERYLIVNDEDTDRYAVCRLIDLYRNN